MEYQNDNLYIAEVQHLQFNQAMGQLSQQAGANSTMDYVRSQILVMVINCKASSTPTSNAILT